MNSPSPSPPPDLNPPKSTRKRKLAARLTDSDNAAQPALKQQRLAVEQLRRARVSAQVEEVDDDEGPSTITSRGASPSDPRRVLEAADGTAPPLQTQPTQARTNTRTSKANKSSAIEVHDSESEVDVDLSLPKKSQKGAGMGVKKGKKVGDNKVESAEEELERLMKSWNSSIYGFYDPIPAIDEIDGRRVHIFSCSASGCKHKIRRYLDKNDRCSTSNLHDHAKKCWGDEVVKRAQAIKDLNHVRQTIGKIKNNPDGDITAMFSRAEEKGAITYSHRQHTTEQARAEIVRWVAESMRPFSIVEDQGFQVLMKTGRPMYRIPSAVTVGRDVKHVFKKTKKRIGKMLRDYDGKLSFATDGWTSTNHKAYIAVTVHLIMDDKPLVLLLDIIELPISHSGSNLAHAFAEILKEFGIQDKILGLACDNASANKTMTDKLVRHLPGFRGEKSRVRCFLHIINLVAKVILRQFECRKSSLGSSTEAVEDEGDEEVEEEGDGAEDEIKEKDVDGLAELSEASEEDVEPVRQVLTKLHKLSFAVKNSSTLALPEWFRILEQLNLPSRMIPRDVSTRWNSTYDMLKFVVDYRAAIDELTDNRKLALRAYELSNREWKIAQQLCDVFKHATTSFSASTSSIAKIIPAMEKIKGVLSSQATETSYLSCIRSALTIGADLLQHYYELTDHSDIYRIATVLHPSYKLAYLEKAQWPKDWVKRALEIVQEEFAQRYADIEIETSVNVRSSLDQPSSKHQNIFDDLSDLEKIAPAPVVDELALYLKQPREKVDDVLKWWLQRQNTFPRLSRMALNYHSVPATSVAVERAFSQGRILLSHIRNRLSAESTRALLCLGAWYRSGLVDMNDINAAAKLPEVNETPDDMDVDDDF
ncbi:hypothetical protein NP233_g1903 [Leucocoprinus birnbaumii]|uniref:HAT C-terminal dimerisation domain-containing protein n=1 Tax=Leucocoprinus birnbaumii TaxID=56174 RepID=A0AAD5YXM2_9AGAR|nr:hypothetical protein NP233_g1903 [Leucocoprinus birnbaumii]